MMPIHSQCEGQGLNGGGGENRLTAAMKSQKGTSKPSDTRGPGKKAALGLQRKRHPWGNQTQHWDVRLGL